MQKLDIEQYRVSTQVESCGFKIDQVITNIKTGKKLAIECDGPTHFDDGDGQVRVESDYDRQLVLETAHWEFYRISYIDWQQTRQTAQEDLLKAINDHFANHKKQTHIERKKPVEHEYVPLEVEVPADLIAEQKERAASAPSRGYFGRPPAQPKTVKSVAAPQAELFSTTNNENAPAAAPPSYRSAPRATVPRPAPPARHVNKTPVHPEKSVAFSQIGEISLSKARSIVISRREDGSYWFNEKVTGSAYTGFTQKGFGFNTTDYNDFKQSLITLCHNNAAPEKRFRVNATTELVVYHPTPDTVDIRQYVTSQKYTGWTKKGIRMTNENAKKIAEKL